MQPAAIRYANPGAMYPGPSSRRFGSTGHGVIGGGHKIAQFPTPVHGAAAQFDLLRNNYAGMSLADLVRKWSGGNSSGAYTNFVAQRTGLNPNTVITAELLADPTFAIEFAKAKSQWETGKKYPLSDDQWREAHRMAYGLKQASTDTRPSPNAGPPPAAEYGDLSPPPLTSPIATGSTAAAPPVPQQRPGGATPSFASVMAEGWMGNMDNDEINRMVAQRMPQPIKPMNSILADLLGGK